jgi:ubiquitin-conjugating enzyme E2 variant
MAQAPALREQSEHPHALSHQILEGFGVVAAAALLLANGVRVAMAAHSVVVGGGAALFGVVLADLFSGLVHWGFDRYFDESTPFFGPSFVKPFRLHHTDPGDILRHGFLETNGNTSLAVIVPLLLLLAVPLTAAGGVFAVVAMMSASLLAILTNQLHKWAHDPNPSTIVAWMQEKHLILPRDHHQVHHTFPHESHYCITTGWLNSAASRIGLWSTMERAIESMFDVKAHRD